MKLSVVIVNHNMYSFLKQGIPALIRACRYIDYELIVVDDNSNDGSVAMIKSTFPEVTLMENESHFGVAKSRNVGIRQSKGEYVLLVNADTISGKKTLENVVDFMEHHADAGALGVRMLTSRGKFLTESRTGVNKSWNIVFKVTGLAKYFPKSRLYKSDSDTWIEEEEFDVTEVDMVNGAFMLLRKSALNDVGAIDERFNNYGHDIDLSFRLRLAGYKNYYFPKTYILNFQENRVKQFSLAHFKQFYGAMFIFAAKYLFHMPKLKLPGIPRIFAPKYEIER
ncbi:glycosyltransferase family 2 protein [Mucilaginibacter glaciei]|uniref:Glycosyltransferase family 2 protein n=1 Tax=Mucilaginibacter glaciei TaxID=2772109 RepID=A0A926NN53_9SPHI|nr:glycosyltransferase family 2 protein [Mucilaginibacter glaciei]MBD1392268.1 glycosyltransferase family 2 protein [Mucilaginibacter glaciei]